MKNENTVNAAYPTARHTCTPTPQTSDCFFWSGGSALTRLISGRPDQVDRAYDAGDDLDATPSRGQKRKCPAQVVSKRTLFSWPVPMHHTQ